MAATSNAVNAMKNIRTVCQLLGTSQTAGKFILVIKARPRLCARIKQAYASMHNRNKL